MEWCDDQMIEAYVNFYALNRAEHCLLISSISVSSMINYYKNYRNKEDKSELRKSIISRLGLLKKKEVVTIDEKKAIFEIFPKAHGIIFHIYNKCHFSLLFFWKKNKNFYHYDTLMSNIQGGHIDKCIEIRTIFKELSLVKSKDAIKIYTPVFTIQQKHYWECGYYMLLFTKYLIYRKYKEKLTTPIPKSIFDSKAHFNTAKCKLVNVQIDCILDKKWVKRSIILFIYFFLLNRSQSSH